MNLPDFIIAIPARYASSRFPGKALALLGEEPMLCHVIRRALDSGAKAVWVATDDQRIIDVAQRFQSVHIALTGSHHHSGTDRLAECAQQAHWPDDSMVVNVQGDEPFVPISGIHAVVRALAESHAPMATLATPIHQADELFNPHVVKLVLAANHTALYFSRAPIPWHRDAFVHPQNEFSEQLLNNLWLRHIGLYAYRAGFLRQFTSLPQGRLEKIESLEQLRVLEAGFAIRVALSPEPFPPGIDTPQDLEQAERWYKNLNVS